MSREDLVNIQTITVGYPALKLANRYKDSASSDKVLLQETISIN